MTIQLWFISCSVGFVCLSIFDKEEKHHLQIMSALFWIIAGLFEIASKIH